MSLITLKNVKKEYGKNQVLFENLSLEIEKGEFVGFVGKSGAGKTTLLNIIGLITDISEGTITIDGHQNLSMNGKNAMILRRYTIGYLFQNYGLIEDESVLWNLKLALEYKKIKREEKLKLINKYLKQFELSDMLNKKVYQLSGGEQQRIAIIKLILQGSQIILADEPTSGLDKENELIVMKLLKELNEKVFSKYPMITVGETLETTVEDGKKYSGFKEHELNMIFTFEHMNVDNGSNSKWSAERFKLSKLKSIMNRWQMGLQGNAWNSLYWNNHDQPRVVSRFGNDQEYWEKSAKMLGTCLHMMQGTPYIYQGEEIGMTNDYLEKIEDYEDIESLTSYYQRTEGMGEDPEYMFKCVQKKSRDNARTAMQWDDSEYAGFGDAGCWFTINPNYKTINVKNQINDAESIYSYYKKLIQLRKNYPIIVYGDFHPLYEESEKNYCYIRELGKEKLLVLCSFSEEEQLVELPDEFLGRKGITLISNYDKLIDLNNCIEDEKTVLLKAYEARVIYYN